MRMQQIGTAKSLSMWKAKYGDVRDMQASDLSELMRPGGGV